jgi:hypothetical protein
MTKQLTAVRINADSTSPIMEIDLNENNDTLGTLQGIVGGWVQAVDLQGKLAGFTLWVNEEGKFGGFEYNEVATRLWEMSYGDTDFILGNAVITAGVDDEGETMSLTDEQTAYLSKIITR